LLQYSCIDDNRSIAAQKADTVVLWCKTTKSGDVNWARTTPDEHTSYVYINGSFAGRDRQRYSIIEQSSLRIYNAHLRDSGLYDCYQSGQVRIVSYELNVTGKKTVHCLLSVFNG